ncbi:MAG: hypothetical protein WKF75_13095 [Singulisphaera sp.]
MLAFVLTSGLFMAFVNAKFHYDSPPHLSLILDPVTSGRPVVSTMPFSQVLVSSIAAIAAA